MPPKRQSLEQVACAASQRATGAPASGAATNNAVYEVSEHQLFLQAFEKPTQIYRYLRTRHMVLPLFLQRSLTYMPTSCGAVSGREKRESYRVDSLLETVMKKNRQDSVGPLRLQLSGLQDASGVQDTVELNMAVVKANNSKTGHVSKVFTHSCLVRRNHKSCEMVTIPEEAFFPLNDASSKKGCVFTLLLVASLRQQSKPSAKNSVDSDNTDSDATDTESSLESSPKRACVSTTLTGELVIYDETGACQLAEGDYQLLLRQHVPQDITSTRWHSISTQLASKLSLPQDTPTLSLGLQWGHGEGRKLRSRSQKEAVSPPVAQERKQTRVYYQFLFHSNSRQITEARGDLKCPWCYVDCRRLYSLLKHLKLCHSRFVFNYTPYRGGAKIDVSVNDAYDGSYMGNPQKLVRRKSGLPLRRTPITYFMVCRPHRPLPTLSEFLQDYQEELGLLSGMKLGATIGHNRAYYHSHTCMPVKAEEFDYDSERENDPGWLREKTQRMLDDFTDVNDGEKVVMKLWNLHIMRMGYVADCHIPHACNTFVDKHAAMIMSQNLYKNLLLHLCNLLDFGLITSSVLYTCTRRLQMFATKNFFSKSLQHGK